MTGQFQGFVLVVPANRPVADLCCLVLTIHLNRSHIHYPYAHDIRLHLVPNATFPKRNPAAVVACRVASRFMRLVIFRISGQSKAVQNAHISLVMPTHHRFTACNV